MSALADLRILATAPWLAALVILLLPGSTGLASRVRWGIALAGAAVIVAAALVCVGGAPALELAWLGRGSRLALAIQPLAAPGLVLTAIAGLLAVTSEMQVTRGRLAATLGLQGAVILALLAGDVVVLASAWALAAALVPVALSGGADLSAGAGGSADMLSGGSDMSAGSGAVAVAGRTAGRTLALGLAVGAVALLLAAGGLVVAYRAATAGADSAALVELAAIRAPISSAGPIAAALVVAAALALGLAPLHAGMSEGTASGGRGAAWIVGGPVRWLGVDALIRLWAPLAPLGAAALAPGLAVLAGVGGIYAGLAARALTGPRRTARIALVAWSLAALGVATLAHEGLCGALVLASAATLAGPGPWGPARRIAFGLAGALGGSLVVVANLRFADLTLGALAPWCACAAALALVLAASALADGTGASDPGPLGMCKRSWSGALASAAAAALLFGLVVRPGALLGPILPHGQAWVHAIALQRCLALHEPKPTPVRLPAERPGACESPLGGLRAGLSARGGEGP